MKILWITNTIIGGLFEKLYNRSSNGLWMDALLKDFIKYSEHKLIIATTGDNKASIYHESDGIKYYLLPGGIPIKYNPNKKNNVQAWKELMEKEKPDIIHIWGSEFRHGLAALTASPNTPAVVYIQGILELIGRYYEAGLENSDIIKNITFRDIIKNDSILAQKRKYYKRAVYEKELFELTGNIISENLWCDTHCKAISPNIKIHRCPLNINQEFSNYEWDIEKIERHSIMCNASGYPLKGLHIIIKAIDLVRRIYPDVKLYVPGIPQVSDGSIEWSIRKAGYTKIIERMIRDLNLQDNIIFTGNLSAKEMAEKMMKVNTFVLGSALENHSSTLKEAMCVGVPCISSIVGGIPEYVIHNENGLLYRFEEYEMLAKYICDVFKDDGISIKLSKNAKQTILGLHNNEDIYIKIINIYEDILSNK